MIIDAHAHVNPDPLGCGDDHDATVAFLLKNLDAARIDKAVLLPVAADVPYVKRTDNRFIAECCRDYPDRFIGFASVNPFEHSDAAAHFEEEVGKYGLKGLKLVPRFQGFSAADPRIAPLVEKAAELGLPVAIDCMLWKSTPLKDQLPFNIDVLCKRVPEAKVIMCHAGGFRFLDALAVAVANDNVYLDTSVSLRFFDGTPFEDQFIFVLKQIGAHRVIYGSDHPQTPAKTCFEESKAILAKHEFSEEDTRKIFGETLLSILPGGGTG